MNLSGDKIISVLTDSLSIEEIEKLLERKKNTIRPDKVTERTKWMEHYKNEILDRGILFPPLK